VNVICETLADFLRFHESPPRGLRQPPRSFNREPTATAFTARVQTTAVAVGSGLNEFASQRTAQGATNLSVSGTRRSSENKKTAQTNVVPATKAGTLAQDGLVALWKLDDGIGTTAEDSTGHGHTGRLYGSVSWTSAAIVGPYALAFRSSGQGHVVVPDSPDLQFSATQSFSLTAWVCVPSMPGHWVGIVEKSRDIGKWYGISINPSNRWVSSSGAGGSADLEGPAVAIGWSQVAVVQNGSAGTRVLYVDAVRGASGTAQPSNGTGNLWMGGATGFDDFFDGVVDDVRAYNRVLSTAEVQTLAGTAPRLAAGKSPAPKSADVPTPMVTKKDVGGQRIPEKQVQKPMVNEGPLAREAKPAKPLVINNKNARQPKAAPRGPIAQFALKKVASRVPGSWVWGGGVCGIAFSPDCQRLVLPVWGDSKVLDLTSGKELINIPAHDPAGPVGGPHTCFTGGVAVGADGEIVLSRVDQMICVFDKENGRKVKEFEPRPLTEIFQSLWYSKQGWIIGRGDSHIAVWDCRTGKQLNQYNAHDVIVMDVSPDGERIVTIDKGHVIRICNAGPAIPSGGYPTTRRSSIGSSSSPMVFSCCAGTRTLQNSIW